MAQTETLDRTSVGRAGVPGVTAGAVSMTLRLEGAVALAISLLGYRTLGGDWWLFAALVLVPDLSMLGYLANRSVGALFYNVGHSYLSPALLALAGLLTQAPAIYPIALIWSAHIGFDRMMGYGLKYPTGFGVTHLGQKGRAAR